MKKLQRRRILLSLLPLAILLCFVYGYSLVTVLFSAFTGFTGSSAGKFVCMKNFQLISKDIWPTVKITLIWTFGSVLPAMVAGLAIYLLQIPVPTLIAQPLELLSNMNTPLSMLITGILIATGDLKQIVCDRHIWKLAAVRMLLIPAVCLAAFAVLGLLRFGMSAQVVLLLECCPAAAITSVFAVQFGHDEQFAAGCVVLTTLLSIVTLPLCALALTALM